MDYQNKLECYYDAYLSEIERLAKHAFNAHILPFCVACKFDFNNGMGSWFFVDSRNDKIFDHEKWYFCRWTKLKEVLKILDVYLPGVNNSFGEFMPHFKYRDYNKDYILTHK